MWYMGPTGPFFYDEDREGPAPRSWIPMYERNRRERESYPYPHDLDPRLPRYEATGGFDE